MNEKEPPSHRIRGTPRRFRCIDSSSYVARAHLSLTLSRTETVYVGVHRITHGRVTTVLYANSPYDAAVASVLASLHSLNCSSACFHASWWMQNAMAALNSSTDEKQALVSAHVQTDTHVQRTK